ncbi:uncharacterized protein LOC126162127 [Schistocerca cancellata]|uniref:uncharacterized protein LOC126162127 n=1 Tax=Schistocerca cancellata TaxID=274614 RepID=UPI002118AA51|nr:uncharacterized protein LOC126162127 [Schistocerca cancellata]
MDRRASGKLRSSRRGGAPGAASGPLGDGEAAGAADAADAAPNTAAAPAVDGRGSEAEADAVAAKAEARYLRERRILLLCTVLVAASVFLWIVAISTDHWFNVAAPEGGIYINETKRYFLRSNSGLWRICRTTFTNSTAGRPPPEAGQQIVNIVRKCKNHEMWPNDTLVKKDPSIDRGILNYTRSEVCFSIISLLLIFMGTFFSVYTFRNPRYMFKRLAGGIHFLACGSTLAVIEVLISSVAYEKKHLPYTFPPGATHHYGFSIYLAWMVFVFLLFSGVSFMMYSRKHKGARAPNEEIAMADEPTIIGR